MKVLKSLLLAGAVTFMYACNPAEKKEAESDSSESDSEEVVNEVETSTTEDYVTAMAELSSASGSEVSGKATFTDLGDGTVTFKITLENATPGSHAIHLHQNGDCSADDATSAGGHWNPADVEHGKRAVDMKYHAGDIDNVEVGEDGKGMLEMTIEGWSIGGDESSDILNKAVIIHAGADDFESQPSGAAGARVACGVIKKG
ncbi:superoxide dismutase family protein [Fulvivirga sp. RKSG066]|uniref:superoxide dismutase family protein n=1 Tax=Fulvivirga aurantia TaxID=2529383 RepID=UPI0012BB7C2A|nr:superoxide dismutase family protein [Fulvivirga aurantia]MTI21176.1 superoxide dismutase family protein [Fulvivirga aurantia]